MIEHVRRSLADRQPWVWAVSASVILVSAALSYRVPYLGIVVTLVVLGAIVLLQHPHLGPAVVIPAALLGRMEYGPGSDIMLNAAMVLVAVSLGIWGIDMIRRGKLSLVSSRTNRPLTLFLLAGLLSLVIGSATWDFAVPRPGNFTLVQLAQLAIFVLSAGAFWLIANLGKDSQWLRWWSYCFLGIAGAAALVYAVAGGQDLIENHILTHALVRAPFWLLLTAMACGQLLFNDRLKLGWKLCLGAILVTVAYVVFYQERATLSLWVSVVAVVGVLAWFRWPRLRWVAVILLLILTVSGILSSALYGFAGGDAEWQESGGSRIALITRVLQVTMRNPITGLGPAAYRPYARMQPLTYNGALWLDPDISSHNNYVDLFSHTGLIGVGLFLWFAVEVILLGLRLRSRFTHGFESGYVNGMLAAWAGALVVMNLADWMLPFVYNIGFRGFQASVLVWMFLGGLVALENTDLPQESATVDHVRGA